MRRSGWISVAVVLLSLMAGCRARYRPEQERTTLGGRDVVVWRPTNWESGRHPVIIFSHGFTGCATQSQFLGRALSAAGYWVFAPNHRDARCGRGRMPQPESPLLRPDEWSDQTYMDRAEDIRAVLRGIVSSSEFGSRVDMQALGLAGHSLGGYTVVGLAGGWPSWRMPEVKAVLALSPYVQPFLARNTMDSLGVPIMYQGGTADVGITPWLEGPKGAYALSPSPKYAVILEGAGHLAWTDLRPDFQSTIDSYSIAFFDHYLRDSARAALLPGTPLNVASVAGDSTPRAPQKLGGVAR